MLGIRPAIWGLLVSALALIATAARLSAPGAGDPSDVPRWVVTPPSRVGGAGASATLQHGVAVPTRSTAAPADRSDPAARDVTRRDRAPGGARAHAASGGERTGRQPLRTAAGRAFGRTSPSARPEPPAPPVVDRQLEHDVAWLNEGLDLSVAAHADIDVAEAHGGGADALADEAYASTTADAVMTEFLLWEALRKEFKLIPMGYPVNQLRSRLAVEVAGLSVSERNALLARTNETMPKWHRPIMTLGTEYEGTDGESYPSGVEIHDPWANLDPYAPR